MSEHNPVEEFLFGADIASFQGYPHVVIPAGPGSLLPHLQGDGGRLRTSTPTGQAIGRTRKTSLIFGGLRLGRTPIRDDGGRLPPWITGESSTPPVPLSPGNW
jgi:hypothetical protein